MSPLRLVTLAAAVALLVTAMGHDATAQVNSGCTIDTQCKGDRVCDEGVCRAAPRPEPGATVAPPPTSACSVDADCPGNRICENEVCWAVESMSSVPAPAVAPPSPPRTVVATAVAPIATTAIVPPASPPPPAAPVRPRRHGVAGDFGVALGVVEGGGESFAFLGASSAYGVYVSDQVALMLTSSYDAVFTDPMMNLGIFGGALRFTGRDSNNSFRVGLGVAALSSPDGLEGIVGTALSAKVLLMGSRKVGLGLDADVARFDGFTMFRLGISGSLFR